MKRPCHAFCCYANADEGFLQELKKHLMPLQREGLLIVQTDRDISPGKEWEREINHHLESADIILLLVSPDFVASDYCFNQEMQQAIARHEQGTACVIPIIVRPTYWQKAPFSVLQCLPKDGKPVSTWNNKDEAFLSITRGIRTLIQNLPIPVYTNQEKENPLMPSMKEDPSSTSNKGNYANKYNINNPQGSAIGDGAQIIIHGDQIIHGELKDGIHSLEKGSKALQHGDYSFAKKELRIATEEIDEEDRPREASQAHFFLALALLDGKLPRTQRRSVMQEIQNLMDKAISLYPCVSYYRIFACIKKNFFEHNGFKDRLNEVDILERDGASLPSCSDDDENEKYFRRLQPRLQL